MNSNCHIFPYIITKFSYLYICFSAYLLIFLSLDSHQKVAYKTRASHAGLFWKLILGNKSGGLGRVKQGVTGRIHTAMGSDAQFLQGVLKIHLVALKPYWSSSCFQVC